MYLLTLYPRTRKHRPLPRGRPLDTRKHSDHLALQTGCTPKWAKCSDVSPLKSLIRSCWNEGVRSGTGQELNPQGNKREEETKLFSSQKTDGPLRQRRLSFWQYCPCFKELVQSYGVPRIFGRWICNETDSEMEMICRIFVGREARINTSKGVKEEELGRFKSVVQSQ